MTFEGGELYASTVDKAAALGYSLVMNHPMIDGNKRLGHAAMELFLNARGGPMTRAGFEYLLRKHVAATARSSPLLRGKHITPHTLRHSCAMTILQATGDVRKVSLWLGHADIKTTQVYLRADPTEKLDAMEKVVPPSLRRGRFRAPDKLIASLMNR